MRKINKVRIFTNNTAKSSNVVLELKKVLEDFNFEIVDQDYDLAIAVGGDGSFLRMVRSNNFNSNIYYVGVNAGTLGFLQEIKPDKIYDFVECLNKDEFKCDEIGVLETRVKTEEKTYNLYSLNETVIREENLDALPMDVYVENAKLETFMGDGLLISTSVGSTAYNTSFEGAVVYNTLHTLQITPIAPINTKAYRNLLTPLILPEDKHIDIFPIKKDLLVIFDGENHTYKNVEKIECFVKDKKLKFLRMNEYNFIDIINEKFLTD